MPRQRSSRPSSYLRGLLLKGKEGRGEEWRGKGEKWRERRRRGEKGRG